MYVTRRTSKFNIKQIASGKMKLSIISVMSEKQWNKHFNKGHKRYSRNDWTSIFGKMSEASITKQKKPWKKTQLLRSGDWSAKQFSSRNSISFTTSMNMSVLVMEVLSTHTAMTLIHINQINSLSLRNNFNYILSFSLHINCLISFKLWLWLISSVYYLKNKTKTFEYI